MKKILITIYLLGFIVGVYGEEVWSKTIIPEFIPSKDDISETFTFSENYEKIDKIEVEIVAFGVANSGKDYVYANNTKIGYLNYGDGVSTFNINSSYMDSNGNVEMRVDKTDKIQINKSIMYVHYYNKTSGKNEVYNQTVKIEDTQTFDDKFWVFNFQYYNNENITINDINIEIEAFGVSMGEDLVYADGEELGKLNDNDNGFSTTIFTINYPKSEDMLSDGSIEVKVDKSPGDSIAVNSIKLTVFYTSNDGTTTTKTPIPLPAIILTLTVIPIIALRKINNN
jgi:hypothetical protein